MCKGKSSLSRPCCFILSVLSWQPCLGSHVLAPCSACPVLPLQFILSCSTFSCSACPVLLFPVLPFPVLPDLFSRTYLAILSFLTCPCCHLLPALSYQSCPGSLVPCFDLPVLLFLTFSACPALPVQFCLTCTACPVLPVLFCLSYSACPVLAVISFR
jgi:hypothetical protein